MEDAFEINTIKKFPKIGKLSDALTHRVRNNLDFPLSWRAKIKLHGTNGGLHFQSDGRCVGAQSRNNMLSLDSHNAGFWTWMYSWAQDNFALPQPNNFIVYGEWAGPGIQANVAVNKIPTKTFFVFALRYTTGEWVVEPEDLFAIVGHLPGFVVVPWHSFVGHEDVGIDLLHPQTFQGAAAIQAEVESIDKEDPFIKDLYGIEGIGEGLVFYPQGPVNGSHFGELLFKVKGNSHTKSNSKNKTKVDKPSLTPEMYESIQAFVANEVHEARLLQGVAEACGGEYDRRKTGPFIGWICKDVQQETENERAASGITWKFCGSMVAEVARKWYLEKC